jgi:PKD repeat protein
MRKRPVASVVGALLVVILAVAAAAVGAETARAETSTASFTYNGSGFEKRTLIDTHVRYIDGCVVGDDPVTCFPDDFPGTIWFRFQAGIKSTVVTAQSANFQLDAPDSFRQDTNAALSTTNTAIDADGKEVKVTTTPFVELDVAYDAPLANCPKDTIQSDDDLANADTSGCLNLVAHTGEVDIGSGFDLLSQDGTLPYSGSKSFSEGHDSPSLDIGALAGLPSGLLGVHLQFLTNLMMTATQGYLADRSLAASSDPGSPLVSGQIAWPSADPQEDTVHVPCSVPAGDNLIYKLNNNRWIGTADATGTVKLVVEIPVIDDPEFSLASGTLLSGVPVTATGSPDFNKTLAEVQAENKPPVITNVLRAGSMIEGSDTTWTAVATDNCASGSQLTYQWKFSDGGIAFGQIAHHVFADNGTYTAELKVTDPSGNTATANIDDITPIVITNANPSANPLPNKAGAWGDVVQYHADAVDPSPVDQDTLAYLWLFGDGSSAAGRDVTHEFAEPGNYAGSVTVNDKDGGVGSASFITAISKRAATLVYTGATSALPSKSIVLSATLTDDHGKPVIGRAVSYALGSQSAVADTNSAGLSSVNLLLNQKPGTYPLNATFTGDTLYLPSSFTGTFLIGKK